MCKKQYKVNKEKDKNAKRYCSICNQPTHFFYNYIRIAEPLQNKPCFNYRNKIN